MYGFNLKAHQEKSWPRNWAGNAFPNIIELSVRDAAGWRSGLLGPPRKGLENCIAGRRVGRHLVSAKEGAMPYKGGILLTLGTNHAYL